MSPSTSGFRAGSRNLSVSCAWSEEAVARVRSRAGRCLMPHSTPGGDGAVLLEQRVEEAVQPLELLQAGAELERGREGGSDLAGREEVVVVIAVDEPVAGPAFARVVAELRRKDGEDQVAAGLQDPGDLAPVAGPVARDHVV